MYLTSLLIGPLLGVLLIPSTMEAFLFRRASADIGAVSSVSQMPLLAVGDGLLGTGGADVPIDDGALVADLGPSGSVLDIYDVPSTDLVTTYTVKSGDSIASIANMFKVTVNTIRWANDISAKDGVKVGQNLVILPITGVRHRVQKGDTLSSIAKKYKGDTDDIASYNGIESSADLIAGTEIIVPDGEASIPTAQVKKTSSGGKIPAAPASKTVKGGYYGKPVAGGILTQGYHDHYYALDISLPRGQAMGSPILAAAAGKVIVAKPSGFNGGYGSMIIIQHDNGTQTLYAHLSRVDVSVGDTVSKGEKIGAMGSTGRSTGPHLHWEVRGARTPMLY